MRQFFLKIKEWFAHLYTVYKKASQKSNSKYRDLAPIDDIENGGEYLRALDWALNHDNGRIKNIALTGPYGAGKSSVINTYLRNHKRIAKRALRISMATFIDTNNHDSDNTQSTPNKVRLEQNEIETGILKQLFYKVNQQKIPQSRYRKITLVRFRNIVIGLLIFVVFMLGILFVFKADTMEFILDSFIHAGSDLGFTRDISIMFVLAYSAISFFIIAWFIYYILSHFKVKEVSISQSNSKVSVTQDDGISVFNKNMDEIIYFFEKTKYKFVFFEDLDRLDNSEIFIVLRELNTLLNNCDSIKKSHGPIVFIYAVKDDLFIDNERTKYFEFIIPIIPVMNSTNSGEVLLDMLKRQGLLQITNEDSLISEEFIMDISPYISDMRVLQNIVNEFNVYKQILNPPNGIELSDKYMFAMIVFKNLYPQDFSNLQAEKGIIKTAFDAKLQRLQSKRKELEHNKDKFEEILKNIEQDLLLNIRELKIVLLSKLCQEQGIFVRFLNSNSYYSSTALSASDIMNDGFSIAELQKHANTRMEFYDFSNNSVTRMEFPSNFDQICAEYEKRYSYLKSSEEKQVTCMQNKIAALQKQSYNLAGWRMKQLIEADGTTFLPSEVQGNSLLLFMLRRGYINEEYADYINYFKGNSITIDDKKFILSVKDRQPLPYEFKLTHITQVIRSLQEHEFDQKEIYNFSLLNELLAHSEFDAKLSKVMSQLANQTADSWKFIDEFVNITENQHQFIQLLLSNWPTFFDYVFSKPELSYERKLNYLKLFLQHIEDYHPIISQSKKIIRDFLQSHEDVLYRLNSIPVDSVISLVDQTDIVFVRLDILKLDSKLFDYIFNNMRYELNYYMIAQVVMRIAPEITNGLTIQNYTTIRKLTSTTLLEYIYSNIEEYIKNIVLAEDNIHESNDSISDLLKRCISNPDLCKQIIAHEQFEFPDITTCCYDFIQDNDEQVKILWEALFEFQRVTATWNNTYHYWQRYDLSEVLVNFIVLSANALSQPISGSPENDFACSILENNIDFHAFKMLINKLKPTEFNASLAKIDHQHLQLMIVYHYFPFTLEWYNSVYETHEDLATIFILENQTDYITYADKIEINSAIFEALILNVHSSEELRVTLLKQKGEAHMTQNIAIWLCSKGYSINLTTYKKAWGMLSKQDKFKLMIKHLDVLNKDTFSACFSELDKPYSNLCASEKQHDVRLVANDDHIFLATHLNKIGYLTSWRDDKATGNIVCRVRRL